MIEKYTDADFNVTRNPALYYAFVDIAKSVDDKQKESLRGIHQKMGKEISVLQVKRKLIEDAADNFMQESRQAVKLNHNMFSSLEQEDESMQKFHNEHLNFVVLVSHIIKAITGTYEELYGLTKKLYPPAIMTMNQKMDTINDMNQFMAIQAEIQLNGGVLENYVRTLAIVHQNADVAGGLADKIFHVMESYYRMLLHRHTIEGVKIFINPVITDVALRIFENIDSHGEVESGKTKTQVSAYTIRKAETLTKALKDDMVARFIETPEMLLSFIEDALNQLERIMSDTILVFDPQMKQVFKRFSSAGEITTSASTLKLVLQAIKDVNPINVSFAEPKEIKSESEVLVENLKNETLECLADMLLDKSVTFQEIVSYVLDRKASLREYFHEENSFYTCKISEGNPFMGLAPGALQVVPSERPKGDLDKILGSGFAEVREFAESIKSSAKWHDLFMATSPSGTTDKSNVLLIGPQGCGKTEVMRAIGASKDSIGVFAQGSDFQTCWKGEAEKNPKRMFQEGIKLNRESGKHVHFLIDEIDAVLNNDRDSSGGSNLTLEFQILMDGVVSYPNLSVWGATNNPERIPMPMLRRFSKVLIVGELSQDERVKLLKHFLGHMPTKEIDEAKWQEWGQMLVGATGDVIRKIADYLWRKKMNKFVTHNATDAEAVVSYLNSKGKFDIANFDRNEFKKVLGKFFTISDADVQKSVRENLENVAVRSEIQTAVATYDRARKLLNKVNNKIVEPIS